MIKIWVIVAIALQPANTHDCQAERLLSKIQNKYSEIRANDGQCAEINFYHHNLCSLLLSTVFNQRLVTNKYKNTGKNSEKERE